MQSRILNDDVLANILSFASLEAIPSMMQACRLFYHEGPKELLAYGATFDSEEKIPAFFRFILAENGTRCRYLGGLHLLLDDDDRWVPFRRQLELDRDVWRRLINLFRDHSFPLLHTLAIIPAEELFRDVPGLSSVLSTLPSVERVNIHSAGPMTCSMIKRMDQLVRVKLAYGPFNSDISAFELHPLIVFKNSRNTLEQLEVSFFDEPFHHPYDIPQFLQMRDLELAWCSNLAIAPFARAFPHLLHLRYDSTVNHMDLTTNQLMALRQNNRREFLAHSAWKELEATSGHLIDLYVSGLACDVKDVQVFMDQEQTFTMLRDFLDDVRPSKLYLRLPRHGIGQEASALADLFRSQAGSRLQTLTVDMVFTQEERYMDIGAAMVCHPSPSVHCH